MTTQVKLLLALVFIVILLSIPSSAQTVEPRAANSSAQAQGQLPNVQANSNSIDVVASEIALLRKSLQTLNLRLSEISDKVLASGSNQSGAPSEKQNRIAVYLDLLTRAEQRAETLRKELLDRIEKEASLKGRLAQIDEEIRPESIERALNPIGSTRSVELRDTRRRVLDNERRGLDSLLNQTAQSRVRLEDDVRQADSLVSKLRQRILPLIDKEIEKINPK